MLERIEEDSNWEISHCTHPEHNPPGYIVLENGKYKHVCPGCGHVKIFRVNNPVLLKSEVVERLLDDKSKYVSLDKCLAMCES